jgi:hypothetical protein
MSDEPTLAQRVLAAAETLEELATIQGSKTPEKEVYSAHELRREIDFWSRA